MQITKQYRIKHPAEKLFNAWISPHSIITPVSRIEVDPKEGGYYRLYVDSADGTSVMNGEFSTFQPYEKLVYSWEWDKSGEKTIISVNFTSSGEQTIIDLTHSGFQSETSFKMHDSGWDSYIEGIKKILGE